ncbi:MAG TPA: glycoside hydrolase family 13 protein [Gaiellaceae bacterium]|nr:glycoside hydrolase family 13 protein [Gaiellaceae bacterium]
MRLAEESTAVETLLDEPHHDGSELYTPEPPLAVGDTATLLLRTRRGDAERVHLRHLRDGEPTLVEARVDSETGDETWWRASFRTSNPVTRYRWLLSGGARGYAWLNANGLQPTEVAGSDDFVATPGAGGPDWHLSSVVYEIFPDRFATTGAARSAPSWAIAREWATLPTGRGRATPHEWFGGDLPGITAHLDHIAALGANAIYLTPIFPATSTHRYDATTFDRIDPLLGGDGAFAELVAAARRQGIRLIGDLTLNHTGWQHEWFETAREHSHSPERGFYLFDEALPGGYASWLGVPTLPKLDWRDSELHARMRGTVRRWLEAGLDGWRIDVANMAGRFRSVDLNHDVARWARGAADGALLLAEHGHDYRPDLDGTGWDGAMNYAGFLRPVTWWLHGGTLRNDPFSPAPAPEYSGTQMVDVMRRFRAGVPWPVTLHSWTLLDSHDTPRFRTAVRTRERQLVGVGLQMTTPGVPMIFAGDELGLEGEWGEDARRTMPWESEGSWDTALLDGYRRLAELRRASPALQRGSIRYVHVSADAVCYLRETADERLLCLALRAPTRPIAVPFTTLETLFGDDARGGVLPSEGPSFHVWRIHG